jgi:hypothetical protein
MKRLAAARVAAALVVGFVSASSAETLGIATPGRAGVALDSFEAGVAADGRDLVHGASAARRRVWDE